MLSQIDNVSWFVYTIFNYVWALPISQITVGRVLMIAFWAGCESSDCNGQPAPYDSNTFKDTLQFIWVQTPEEKLAIHNH